jgi:glycosyltransferase involved in cell wall biosynthesis
VMPVADRLGGAEKMLWLLLLHVDRSRVAPSVVFLKNGPFVADCASINVPAFVIPSGRLRDISAGAAAIRQLARHFRQSRPDLIVEWFGHSHPWVAPAASLASVGSRVVWWQHSVVARHDALSRLISALPARAVGAESIAAAEAQERIWPHRATFVVHSGVDDDRPDDHRELRLQTRAELAVADGDVLVGMIARVQRWKGQHHLLRAVAGLRDSGVASRALLVGGDAHDLDPGYNDEIRQLISALRLGNLVTWVDHTPDPRRYLYALDIFVNVSVRENLSLALLEAMAAERCIVAVGDGGTPEVITDRQSGLLLERSDSSLLQQSLRELIGDTALRARLGKNARQEYERRFTALGWARAVEDRIAILCDSDYRPRLAAVARNPR